MDFRWDILVEYAPFFLKGTLLTIGLSIASILIGTILGLFIGLGKIMKNKLLAWPFTIYITFFRGTPLLVQIFIWFFAVFLPMPRIQEALKVGPVYFSNRGIAIPWFETHSNTLLWILIGILGIIFTVFIYKLLLKKEMETGKRKFPLIGSVTFFLVITLGTFLTTQTGPVDIHTPIVEGRNFVGGYTLSPGFSAILLGLVIYTSTYIAEIIRAGISGVPKGQIEAAKALGLKSSTSLRLVIFPQAIRIIIPPLTSQYLNLIKNSSLAVAIGFQDIVSVGGTVMNQTGRMVEGVTIMIAVYLICSLVTSLLMNYFNKKAQLVER